MKIIGRLSISLVVVLAVVAFGTTTAFANLGKGGPQGAPWGKPVGVPGQSHGSLRVSAGVPAIVAPEGGPTGFDWGDAAIGAGVAAAVVLAAGVVIALRRRRHDRLAAA